MIYIQLNKCQGIIDDIAEKKSDDHAGTKENQYYKHIEDADKLLHSNDPNDLIYALHDCGNVDVYR